MKHCTRPFVVASETSIKARSCKNPLSTCQPQIAKAQERCTLLQQDLSYVVACYAAAHYALAHIYLQMQPMGRRQERESWPCLCLHTTAKSLADQSQPVCIPFASTTPLELIGLFLVIRVTERSVGQRTACLPETILAWMHCCDWSRHTECADPCAISSPTHNQVGWWDPWAASPTHNKAQSSPTTTKRPNKPDGNSQTSC